MKTQRNFVQGRKANNALLFGDSGTGKSTSIKAIVNQYYDQGLRMIEIYKHQSRIFPMSLQVLRIEIISLLYIWMIFHLKSLRLNISFLRQL